MKNGTRVVMGAGHPHRGKTGVVKKQPDDPTGVAGMYLIEFDGPYDGSAFAYPSALRRLPS